MTPPGYIGRYINLERSPERRRDVEAVLARLGLADRYERFLGVDGRTAPGGSAAWLSTTGGGDSDG